MQHSVRHQNGVFQHTLELLQEARPCRPIKHPMVAGERSRAHARARATILPSSATTGTFFTAPTARIALAGGLIIALNSSIPEHAEIPRR